MKKTLSIIAAALICELSLLASPGIYNVRDYGAQGDGRTLDHSAVNRAIEACAADGRPDILMEDVTFADVK